jgi:hypothetical protein
MIPSTLIKQRGEKARLNALLKKEGHGCSYDSVGECFSEIPMDFE